MSADEFLDSNILVYSVDARAPEKMERAHELVGRSLTNGSGCISFQVVQETLNVLTGKFGMSADSSRRLLDEILVPLWRVNPTAVLYQTAMSLQGRYGFSFYDSLIVAAALEAGCTRLYSEDLQHGQQGHRLTIVNPFQRQ